MRIPEHVLRSPDYPLVAQYYGAEETVKIIESGIPINHPGVVPSLQVPPGEGDDCMGAAGLGLLGEELPLPQISPELARYGLLQTVLPTNWVPTLDSAAGLPLASSSAPNQVLEGADPALAWVEDNWEVIAISLGAVLVLSLGRGKRR